MKKLTTSFLLFVILILFLSLGYLSIVGYETDRFNSLLEKKITSNLPKTKIKLNKIKIKINLKSFNFFMTTSKPEVQYYENNINLNKIDANIKLKSLFLGKPEIEKIYIASGEIDIKEIKKIIKYSKPSNIRKFVLNDVSSAKIVINTDLILKDNTIDKYELNGIVKNFYSSGKNVNFEKTSFIYLIKTNKGEINNIRGNINGFQVSSGNVVFNKSKLLKIQGSLKSALTLKKGDFDKLIKSKIRDNFDKFQINGKVDTSFKIDFDKTLKLIDYQIEAKGDVKKSELKLKRAINFEFIKNKINNLIFEKANFKINLDKGGNKIFTLNGLYKVNNNTLQNFDLTHLVKKNLQQLSIKGNFDNEIIIPFINYSSEDKIVNVNTDLEINNSVIKIKKFSLSEGKNKINITNLFLKDNKLLKMDNLSAKTFIDNKLSNDFEILMNKNVKINGLKYDASNLTKLVEEKSDSNFLKNISKEISVNISEVSTSVSDVISNFTLIGNIDKGRFSKIVSKGEFAEGKYLDISLKQDSTSKRKILEIYSDLPKSLLSNYKFFNGLSGGQLLLNSSYNDQNNNLNLVIENFKVKDAPGLVKLLSLADFGGMVDAMSGEGLSFERLEMKMEKNKQVLTLKELYAIGPSISILMDGYVESKTGLISLRGTMVPAKTLNKFLSKLPIVGDILIPKEIGEGLFGISFKMKGLQNNLKTTVNPIKTLTPRFIQKALKKSK